MTSVNIREETYFFFVQKATNENKHVRDVPFMINEELMKIVLEQKENPK
jgi:hypothetical protein